MAGGGRICDDMRTENKSAQGFRSPFLQYSASRGTSINVRCILETQEVSHLTRISFAFRAFFAILFGGNLPADVALAFGYTKAKPQPAAKPAPPPLLPSDGALQMLGILQRDARLIDFLMEDIAAYSDDQVGAAVRNVHEQSRATLGRYVRLAPVIDGVEGTYTKLDTNDPAIVKLLGNVPAKGKATGGLLRHRGWRSEKIDLPQLTASQNAAILAPAEVEVE